MSNSFTILTISKTNIS